MGAFERDIPFIGGTATRKNKPRRCVGYKCLRASEWMRHRLPRQRIQAVSEIDAPHDGRVCSRVYSKLRNRVDGILAENARATNFQEKYPGPGWPTDDYPAD